MKICLGSSEARRRPLQAPCHWKLRWMVAVGCPPLAAAGQVAQPLLGPRGQPHHAPDRRLPTARFGRVRGPHPGGPPRLPRAGRPYSRADPEGCPWSRARSGQEVAEVDAAASTPGRGLEPQRDADHGRNRRIVSSTRDARRATMTMLAAGERTSVPGYARCPRHRSRIGILEMGLSGVPRASRLPWSRNQAPTPSTSLRTSSALDSSACPEGDRERPSEQPTRRSGDAAAWFRVSSRPLASGGQDIGGRRCTVDRSLVRHRPRAWYILQSLLQMRSPHVAPPGMDLAPSRPRTHPAHGRRLAVVRRRRPGAAPPRRNPGRATSSAPGRSLRLARHLQSLPGRAHCWNPCSTCAPGGSWRS